MRTISGRAKKILITGNMGYIGPIVVRELRNLYPDAILIGLDTGFFANNVSAPVFVPEILIDQQIYCDIRLVSPCILEGVDAVVNLAAISNDPMGNMFEKVTLEINYMAVKRLARIAKECGVKSFVFASSCSVYGNAEEEFRTEDSPLNPLTAYAESKILSEQSLAEFADKEFRVTCLRFATACGMSDRLRLDLVLNDFVASAFTDGKILILSDGSPWRPLIHVKDMARAICWSINRQADNGGEFLAVNAGSNKGNYQIISLAETIAALVPNVEVEVNKNAQPDSRSYKVSFDRFSQLAPDYQPIHDLETTVNELMGGLEAMGFSNRNFRDSSYIRLKSLLHLRENGFLDENLEWKHPNINSRRRP